MHEQAFESDDMSTGSHEDGVSSDSEYDGDHDESADDADQPQSEEIYREELDQDDEEEDAEEEVDLGGGSGSGGAADEAGSGRPQLTEAEDATIEALLQTVNLSEDESDVEPTDLSAFAPEDDSGDDADNAVDAAVVILSDLCSKYKIPRRGQDAIIAWHNNHIGEIQKSARVMKTTSLLCSFSVASVHRSRSSTGQAVAIRAPSSGCSARTATTRSNGMPHSTQPGFLPCARL